MIGDVHVQFCEYLWGKFLRATHLVCVVQYVEDAQRIEKALKARFERYGLELHPA